MGRLFLLPYPGPSHLQPATGPPAASVSGLRSSVFGIRLRDPVFCLRLLSSASGHQPDTSQGPATCHQPPATGCLQPASLCLQPLSSASVFSLCLQPLSSASVSGLRSSVFGLRSSGLRLRACVFGICLRSSGLGLRLRSRSSASVFGLGLRSACCLLPPATCHLQPACCLLPPATCLLPAATCHRMPAACLRYYTPTGW